MPDHESRVRRTAAAEVRGGLVDAGRAARRLMAASEALVLSYGGVSLVHRACGLSRKAIVRGIREIQAGTRLASGRIRRPGPGGRPLRRGIRRCWPRWIS